MNSDQSWKTHSSLGRSRRRKEGSDSFMISSLVAFIFFFLPVTHAPRTHDSWTRGKWLSQMMRGSNIRDRSKRLEILHILRDTESGFTVPLKLKKRSWLGLSFWNVQKYTVNLHFLSLRVHGFVLSISNVRRAHLRNSHRLMESY